MIKNKKGRILITLLVITGLAGQPPQHTLKSKERRFIVKELKESRNLLLNSIEGLTDKQLQFYSKNENTSISEIIYQLATVEDDMWRNIQSSADRKKSAEGIDKTLTDSGILQIGNSPDDLALARKSRSGKIKINTVADALNSFRENRNRIILYAKTTTDDVRNDVLLMRFGYIDAYQAMLFACSKAEYYSGKINEIKATPEFKILDN